MHTPHRAHTHTPHNPPHKHYPPQFFASSQVPGYNATDDDFDHIGQAFLSLYVLVTTENFPQVMYPALVSRPYIATVFFVSFLFVVLWIILPLTLAIVLDFYNEQHTSDVLKRHVKQRDALLAAFMVIQDDLDQPMTSNTFHRLIKCLPHPVAMCECTSAAAAAAVERTSETIFSALDVSNSKIIYAQDFLYLAESLRTVRRFQRSRDRLGDGGGAGGGGSGSGRGGAGGRGDYSRALQEAGSGDFSASFDPPPPVCECASPPCSCGFRGERGDDDEGGRGGSGAAGRSGHSGRGGIGGGLLEDGEDDAFYGAPRRQNCASRLLSDRVPALIITTVSWALALSNAIFAMAYHMGMQEDYNFCIGITSTTTAASQREFAQEQIKWGKSPAVKSNCARASTTLYQLETASAVFSCLSAVLLILPVASYGFRAAYAGTWQRVDLVLVVLTFLSSFLLLVGPSEWLADTIDAGLSDVLEMGRALRVLRVITLSRRFQKLLETLADCAKLMGQLVFLYLVVTFSFAVLSMQVRTFISTSTRV